MKRDSESRPAPDALRAICKQGAVDTPGQSGVGKATEGSEWIIECARRDDPRPLHVLVWGGKYVRIWDGRKTIFDRLTTKADKAGVFGVTEFVLPVPEGFSAQNAATMIFARGKPPSEGVNEGKVLRFTTRLGARSAGTTPRFITTSGPTTRAATQASA